MKGIKGSYFLVFLLAGLFLSFPLYGAESFPVVVIDPAHGGDDLGVKLSDSRHEKDITLQIALELQKELMTAGNIKVQLTRTADRDVSIAERNKMVQATKARMMLSIHVNAGFGPKAAGYEVYFPGFKAIPVDKKNGAAGIINDMTGNRHLNESVALAQDILRKLQTVFPRKERGLREAPVPILEGLSLPAVAVEIGFATNLEDKKAISDENIQKLVAKALSKSILEFMRPSRTGKD